MTTNPIEDIFRHLLSLCPRIAADGEVIPVEVEFDPEAQNVFHSFRERMYSQQDKFDGVLASHFGKFDGLVARVSLILALLDEAATDGNAVDTHVRADHVTRSVRLFEDYMIPMAIRVYGDAGLPNAERTARKIARAIKSGEFSGSFSVREVCRKKWQDLKKSAEVRVAIAVLVECGWVKQDLQPTNGRTAERWDINPAINEAE